MWEISTNTPIQATAASDGRRCPPSDESDAKIKPWRTAITKPGKHLNPLRSAQRYQFLQDEKEPTTVVLAAIAAVVVMIQEVVLSANPVESDVKKSIIRSVISHGIVTIAKRNTEKVNHMIQLKGKGKIHSVVITVLDLTLMLGEVLYQGKE